MQCKTIISAGVPAFKIDKALLISSIVAIPVDKIIFLFSISSCAIFLKYGKFVTSPEGIFQTFCLIEYKKSIDSSSNAVEKTSKPKS